MQSFLEKLIDWQDFERFVAELYSDSDEVLVQHNVTEQGKSTAKRQIDVLVTQKTKLHTIKTVIECKLWKKPVDRQVIDVLSATVEDLNANKGAIFTTKGYEQGAIEYAKHKNIDIFIVRDIYEDEWGEPGRHISFYMQTFHSKIEDISIGNPGFFSPTGQMPTTARLDFGIFFSQNQEYPDHFNLISISETGIEKGPNFVKLLIDVRNDLLNQFRQGVNGVIQSENDNAEIAYETKITLDFSEYKFRYFKHGEGFISFDNFSFILHQSILQTKFEFDRASTMDFAMIVENYITNQRNYASKRKDESNMKLSEPIVKSEANPNDALKNGSILKLSLEYYIGYSLQPSTKIIKTQDVTVKLKTP